MCVYTCVRCVWRHKNAVDRTIHTHTHARKKYVAVEKFMIHIIGWARFTRKNTNFFTSFCCSFNIVFCFYVCACIGLCVCVYGVKSFCRRMQYLFPPFWIVIVNYRCVLISTPEFHIICRFHLHCFLVRIIAWWQYCYSGNTIQQWWRIYGDEKQRKTTSTTKTTTAEVTATAVPEKRPPKSKSNK